MPVPCSDPAGGGLTSHSFPFLRTESLLPGRATGAKRGPFCESDSVLSCQTVPSQHGVCPPSLLLSAQLSPATGILPAGVSPAAPLCCCFQAHGPCCLVEECPGEGPDVVRGCPVFQPPDHPVPAWECGHQVSRGPLQGERAHLGTGVPRARRKPGLVWALGEAVGNPCSHRPRAGQGCVPGGPGLFAWEPPAEWRLAAVSRKAWSEARAWGDNGGGCVRLSSPEPQPGGLALPGLGTQAPQWTGSAAPWEALRPSKAVICPGSRPCASSICHPGVRTRSHWQACPAVRGGTLPGGHTKRPQPSSQGQACSGGHPATLPGQVPPVLSRQCQHVPLGHRGSASPCSRPYPRSSRELFRGRFSGHLSDLRVWIPLFKQGSFQSCLRPC